MFITGAKYGDIREVWTCFLEVPINGLQGFSSRSFTSHDGRETKPWVVCKPLLHPLSNQSRCPKDDGVVMLHEYASVRGALSLVGQSMLRFPWPSGDCGGVRKIRRTINLRKMFHPSLTEPSFASPSRREYRTGTCAISSCSSVHAVYISASISNRIEFNFKRLIDLREKAQYPEHRSFIGTPYKATAHHVSR